MSTSSSPCAACKFLRRKCTQDCVFAPYFPAEQPQKFSTVHKVFGASNVSKLLNDLESKDRDDAVSSLAYEADYRIKDPVYGCVGLISILQQHLKGLAYNLDLAKKELASMVGPSTMMQLIQNPYLQSQFHPNAVGVGASSSHPHQYNAAQMMGMMQLAAAGPGPGPEPLSMVDLQMQHQLMMQQQQQQLQQELSGQLVIRDVAQQQQQQQQLQQQLSGQLVIRDVAQQQQQHLQQQLRGQLVIRDGIQQQPLQQHLSGPLVRGDGIQQPQHQHEVDNRQLAMMIQAREEREVMRKLRKQHREIQDHYYQGQPDQLMRFNQGFNQEDNSEFGQMGTQGAAMAPLMSLRDGFDGGNPYPIQQQQQQQLVQHQQVQEQLQLGENPHQIQQQQLHLQQQQLVQEQQLGENPYQIHQQQQDEQILLVQQPQQSRQQELLFHEHHYHPPTALNEEEGKTLGLPPNC